MVLQLTKTPLACMIFCNPLSDVVPLFSLAPMSLIVLGAKRFGQPLLCLTTILPSVFRRDTQTLTVLR